MVEETNTPGRSGTPWKRHYEDAPGYMACTERSMHSLAYLCNMNTSCTPCKESASSLRFYVQRTCEIARASVQTYVRSSAHMVLNLKGPSESKRLPTLFEGIPPTASEGGKPLITTNIFGHPLQIFGGDGQFSFPPAVSPAGFAGGDLAPEDRLKTAFQVEEHPDFAPVVSSAQRIVAAPTSTAEIPDYLARPLAVQLGLVADEEISKTEHVQVTKLKAATSALENLQLGRKRPNHASLLHNVLCRATEDESPSRRREQGLHSRQPLAAFRKIDDPIGRRVSSDGWRGGVLPSVGADLHYASSSGLDPGNVTNVATRWFRHKKAERREGDPATGSAEAQKGGTQKSVPEFLPMLHHLCRQPMRVDRAKRPVVPKKETSSSVVVKGGMVPVDEETTGPPEVTVIRQQGMKAVVERLEFDGRPPPARLPRKQKNTKELGIQTEAPRAPPPTAKISMQRLVARVTKPPPRREITASESSPSLSTENSTLDTGETPEEDTEVSVSPALPDDSQAVKHPLAALQGKSGEEEKSSKESSVSEETSEEAVSDKSRALSPAAWQQPRLWYPPAMWNLLQQSMPTAMGIPNPVGPPNLQTPEAEPAEEGAFCMHPLTMPLDVLTAAFMPFVDGERTRGGITAETAIPDPQRAPDLRKPAVQEEPQQAGVLSWLNEEARGLFPPGFEQILWESLLLQSPALTTGFPVLQFSVKDLTNPWQAVCEEAQWEQQWRLYQQWLGDWQRQRQAYLKATSRRGDDLIERHPDVIPSPESGELKQIKKQQQLMMQEIREEFDAFTRTQRFLGRAFGTQSYRGRAAIGNCRGGRRAWGVFDRTMRTSAERTRQLRMKMLPEVDDYFDVVPPPSLRRTLGRAGGVRGGLRGRSIHLHRGVSGDLRHAHVRRRRKEEVEQKPANTVQKELSDGSPSDDGRRNLEENSRRRHSRPGRLVLEDELECKTTDAENQQSGGEGGEPLDWYDREKLRLFRERKMDTILDEMAEYLGVPEINDGQTLRRALATVSKPEESEAKERAEEAKLRSASPKSAALKLKNRLYASERITEFKRLSGLLAAGKLPPESRALLRDRLHCSARGQQLFVGLLNVEESHKHANSSCAKPAALGGCEPIHEFLSTCTRSNRNVFDNAEATTESKCKPENKQPDTDAGVKQYSGDFHGRGENHEAVSCNKTAKEAGRGVSAGCIDTVERHGNKTSPGMPGRTLLDLSAARIFEARHQGEIEQPEGRLAHYRSPSRPLRLPGSCISLSEAATTPSCDHQSLRKPESSSSTSDEGVKAAHFDASGNCHAKETDSTSFFTNSGGSRAYGPTSEDDSVNVFHPGSSATCVTSDSEDDAYEDQRRFSVIYSESAAEANAVSRSAPVNNESPCAKYNHSPRREMPSKPFFVDHVEASTRPPLRAGETRENTNTFVILHGLRREVDRVALPSVEKLSTVAPEMDEFDWKRRLAKWRALAKSEPHIPLRRAQPTSFPWDEDVIPTCRGKREAIKSGAESCGAPKESLMHSGYVRAERSQVIRYSGNNGGTPSTAARQGLSKVRGEKGFESFLRRKSGTGGGHYGRNSGRHRSEVGSSKPETACAPVPDHSSTDYISKTDLENVSFSWPQRCSKGHCLRSTLAGKEGISTYSIERALVLANFAHFPASDVVTTTEKAHQSSAFVDRLPTNYYSSQSKPALDRRSQTEATRERRDDAVRPSQSLSKRDFCPEKKSRALLGFESDTSESVKGGPAATAVHFQKCLKVNEPTAHASLPRSIFTTSTKTVRFQGGLAREDQSSRAERGPGSL